MNTFWNYEEFIVTTLTSEVTRKAGNCGKIALLQGNYSEDLIQIFFSGLCPLSITTQDSFLLFYSGSSLLTLLSRNACY